MVRIDRKEGSDATTGNHSFFGTDGTGCRALDCNSRDVLERELLISLLLLRYLAAGHHCVIVAEGIRGMEPFSKYGRPRNAAD